MEEIVTGEAVVLDLPAARIPSRVLARLIDGAAQSGIMLLVVGASAAVAAGSESQAAFSAVYISGYVLTLVGYPLVFETLSRGRTPGKMALGLRVVTDDGGPVRFRHALVRALAGAVEITALVGIPAVLASILSVRGKRLGDQFAGTFVLRERVPPPPPSTIPPLLNANTGRWVASLDLSALPESLTGSASAYLSRYWELRDTVRDELAGQLASAISARVSPPPPPGLPALELLGLVTAERRAREYRALAAAAARNAPGSPAPGAFAPGHPGPQPPSW